jgi:Tol biopolymer transport system component
MYNVRRFCLLLLMVSPAFLNAQTPIQATGAFPPTNPDSLRYPQEKHLRNIRPLTFGGNNAEAYFSHDGKQLVFQSDWDKLHPQGCDQIFAIAADPDQQGYRLISTGTGRTTCSYFLPDGRIVFASTHAADAKCPQTPMRVNGRYVWGVYSSFDIYLFDPKTQQTELLIGGPGYDAEATISRDGRYMIFTSTRSGDLDLWRYDFKTKELKQLTHELGYDGGAFFSADGKHIVYRASRFEPGTEAAKVYTDLLKQDVVEPTQMQIFVMDADGGNKRQITNLPGANWAPFFHPNGKQIIFSSNHHSVGKGRPVFSLWLVNLDGTGLERVTYSEVFDAFPMFSPDGKKIVFSSNRKNGNTRDTNVFIADWVE